MRSYCHWVNDGRDGKILVDLRVDDGRYYNHSHSPNIGLGSSAAALTAVKASGPGKGAVRLPAERSAAIQAESTRSGHITLSTTVWEGIQALANGARTRGNNEMIRFRECAHLCAPGKP